MALEMARSRRRRRLSLRSAALVGVMVALASCTIVPRPRETSTPVPPPLPPVELPPPEPANAVAAGVRAGPTFRTLAVGPDRAAAALAAFRVSCPDLVRRTDASGLTRPHDWAAACAAAATWPSAAAAAFFGTHLEPVVVGEGNVARASVAPVMRCRSTPSRPTSSTPTP
jgi:membrane-bound lytic murein transglycosylase A